MNRPRLGFTVLALTTATLAGASEFWLQPAQYRVAPGSQVALRRLVGQQLSGQPWPGLSVRVARFRHYTPLDTLDLTTQATQADTLNTVLKLAEPGTHLVALETTEANATLSATDFNAYLKAEGLDAVLLKRSQRGQLMQPARETYARCAKTLVQVGQPTEGAFQTVVGQDLELIAEQNPYHARPGSLLTVRLLEKGQPVRGHLVRVWTRPRSPTGAPATAQHLHTSPEGRVLLRLPTQPAEILVTALRMHPHPDATQADWQSRWATLTFGANLPSRR